MKSSTIALTTVMALLALSCPEMSQSEKRIQKEVQEELVLDSRVDSDAIRVEVSGQKVELEGTVPGYLDREIASEKAMSIPGVTSVENELDVKIPAGKETPDDSVITDRIRDMLVWDSRIDAEDVKVSVENGIVTLTGNVGAFWKRDAVESIAADVLGVLAIRNRVTVVPDNDIMDREIAADIEAAFNRNSVIEGGEISVKVNDGEVTLKGTVDSWKERSAAFDAAMFTPGVVEVIDLMKVEA